MFLKWDRHHTMYPGQRLCSPTDICGSVCIALPSPVPISQNIHGSRSVAAVEFSFEVRKQHICQCVSRILNFFLQKFLPDQFLHRTRIFLQNTKSPFCFTDPGSPSSYQIVRMNPILFQYFQFILIQGNSPSSPFCVAY